MNEEYKLDIIKEKKILANISLRRNKRDKLIVLLKENFIIFLKENKI